MNRTQFIIAAVALVVPLSVGAVNWQRDSSPFTFPSVVSTNKKMQTLESGTWCRPEVRNGAMTIRYSLPAGIENAALNIYSLSGSLVRSFDLKPGQHTIQLVMPQGMTALGTYVASLRRGVAVRNIQITVVR